MTTDGQKLNTKELAARWGMSVSALQNWRIQRQGPRYLKLGTARSARVLYLVSDIEEFEKKKMVKTKEL